MNRFRPSTASPWLTIARIFVLGWMLLSSMTVIGLLPEKFQRLRALEPGNVPQTPFYGWTAAQIRQMAESQGLTPEWIAGMMISASIVCLLCFWIIGGLLFIRLSATWAGLAVVFILFATGPGFSNLLMVEAATPDWLNILFRWTAVFIWPTFFVMLYLFPNGKFVPSYTRFLSILPYIIFVVGNLLSRLDAVGTILLASYGLGGVISQIYRYRWVSTPEERQQTKWVVFGLGMIFGSLPLTFLLPVIFPTLAARSAEGFWWEFIGNGVVGILLPALLPLAIAASILRYRLWDIDIIIRRTLQYSLVTGVLALVYFGGITFLQAVFSSITGEKSNLAIAISTLAIAALFNPVRKRVQEFINRRFYRQKYNAEQALAEFAATARNETDLECLTGKLTGAVQETLQPEKLSLWLRRIPK